MCSEHTTPWDSQGVSVAVSIDFPASFFTLCVHVHTYIHTHILQARQRSGRAGREGPGQCYRLYTEECFEGAAVCVHLSVCVNSIE